MHELIIDLQEGFLDEDVFVAIDGHEVFQGKNIVTRNQIGLAKQIKNVLQPGKHTVRICLGDRGIDQTFSLDSQHTPYLGISVHDNDIVFQAERNAFGYL